MESVAATCRWIAAVRARESERPDRLFNDPYAAKLAGEAGFDPAKPAIWLVEGLLMYLEEADVRRLLAAVSALAAPGSRISADLINGYFLKFRGTQRLLGYLEKIQAPWRFGTDEPETFFGEYGWKARALEPGELPFGRWHLKTYPREREGTSRMFFVTGEK
jgi:O-methyltransferase involved in polyketide biosynthesis